MLLTIAIPTIETRIKPFTELYMFIQKQIIDNNLQYKVELIYLRDNKELSIGAKRQKMYEASAGIYSVQIDDDDIIASDYCITMIEHIEKYTSMDAFGYIEHCNLDGKVTHALHKNEYNDWWEKNGVYGRTLYFKDPIRTEICKKIGVKDIRFGEDHDFARRLKASGLIKSSMFIDKEMYFYRYKPENHNEKYGIK